MGVELDSDNQLKRGAIASNNFGLELTLIYSNLLL